METAELRALVAPFLQQHQLPASYQSVIEHYGMPIAEALVQQHQSLGRPLLIGINGCQGSGKTTLADALVLLLTWVYGRTAVAISIDDFYLTRNERQQLAANVHPLLGTRGVPGTHDVALARTTLQQLTRGSGEVAVPRFDKARDDRAPAEQWDRHPAPLDIVILEGWCVATGAQPEGQLQQPVNELEAQEDRDGRWRQYVNSQLQRLYEPLFDELDLRIMLQAPSFDCVLRWRQEQEDKLRAKRGGSDVTNSGVMSSAQLTRFIQHYQRLTEHTLAELPARVHFLLQLDAERQIVQYRRPLPLPTD